MSDSAAQVRLDRYQNPEFTRGRSRLTELLWIFLSAVLVESWIPGSWHRRILLRLFGARLGRGVVLKPGLKIKFPWRLTVGDFSWLGEQVWIDNLAPVEIGSHCCISQQAYLCTGSHDWSDSEFSLITGEIRLEHSVWLGARSIVTPGARLRTGAMITAGSLFSGVSEPWTIYRGNPAQKVKERHISISEQSQRNRKKISN